MKTILKKKKKAELMIRKDAVTSVPLKAYYFVTTPEGITSKNDEGQEP